MNVVYSPVHTILAAVVLLIVPIVFHLLAFRKSTRFIHMLTSILIGTFILTVMGEVAGLTHLFDAKIILTLSVLIAGISGRWINKTGIFGKEDILGKNVSKISILLVAGIAIFIFLYQKNTFPPLSFDALNTYLPWARIIVNEHSIPPFHFESNYRYVISYPPMLYTCIAFMFSLFGEYNDSIPAAIPIVYSCFFIFLISNWGEEYGDRTVPYFIVLALLLRCNQYFTIFNSFVLQEAPILFFTTVSFYLLFKYLKTKETIFLVLLSISSALGSLTKDSGLLISVLLFCILMIEIKNKNEIYKLSIFPLFHMPNILWALRNFYYFDNPVYPMFVSVFNNSIYANLTSIATWGAHFPTSQEMAINFLMAFPAFLFTLFYIFKNKRNAEVRYLVACFVIFLFFLHIHGGRLLIRYLYPFLGVFALYAGIEISKLYDIIPIKIIKEKKNVIIKIALTLLCVILIMIPSVPNFLSDTKNSNYRSAVNSINYNSFSIGEADINIKKELNVVEYLQNNEKRKNLIILSDYDLVNNWYGEYTSIGLTDLQFLIRNYEINNEPFDVTKNNTYLYNNLKKIGINYIYDSPERNRGSIEILFNKINQDPAHFELVYNKDGHRLWKIK